MPTVKVVKKVILRKRNLELLVTITDSNIQVAPTQEIPDHFISTIASTLKITAQLHLQNHPGDADPYVALLVYFNNNGWDIEEVS